MTEDEKTTVICAAIIAAPHFLCRQPNGQRDAEAEVEVGFAAAKLAGMLSALVMSGKIDADQLAGIIATAKNKDEVH